jgi:lipopolysaccharide heptosyltransferase II
VPEAPRHILVRCPNPVGDAVMATPALRALRRAHPNASIALLGPAANASLLRGVPSFDEYIPIRGVGLGATLSRVLDLRARGFDWAVLLPDSHRVALDTFFAGVPRRVGYARDPLRRALLSESLAPPYENGRRMPFSMIERYLRITRLLGCPDAGQSLDLVVDDASRERAAVRLAAHGVAADAPLLLVTPGASYGTSKLWPPEHFARACDEIERRLGLLPVLVAAPNAQEQRVARAVAAQLQRRFVPLFESPGNLEDLKALVERAHLVLTNDTGPRHVAVALDRPVIVLMGPTDPRHTAHLLTRQRVLREEVACSPCGRKTCPIDHRCLTRLSPERAVAAAAELLG